MGCWDVAVQDQTRNLTEHRILGADKAVVMTTPAGSSTPVTVQPVYTDEEQMARANTVEDLFTVDLNLTQTYMNLAKEENFGSRWVTSMAEAIWTAEEYIVRVRGHHYKPEFEANLTKYLASFFEGDDRMPKNLDMAAIFRTSIHPFGLQALPIMAGHFAIHGKMANSALIRLSAAPNGIAVITTTAA